VPAVFREDSSFTAVLRWDHVDLDGSRRNRITPGLNFRPTQDTVFRVDYALDFEDWAHRRVDDDVFSVSIATYF
jgi:hypothetical protein